MGWLEITIMLLAFTAVIFNLIIFITSFRKQYPAVTIRLTIFFSGIAVLAGLFAIYQLIVLGGSLNSKSGAGEIIMFVFWLLFLVLAIITAIIHLIRIFGRRSKLYI